MYAFFFFFNDTATTEIYTLSLHDALPIFRDVLTWAAERTGLEPFTVAAVIGVASIVFAELIAWGVDSLLRRLRGDRKSTRLNSSHQIISYAVFCLKKKNSERF